jgi:hypothetical protein
MRREFLDHVLFWNGCDLERKLAEFQTYYNAARCHASFGGPHAADLRRQKHGSSSDLNQVRWSPIPETLSSSDRRLTNNSRPTRCATEL